MKIQLKDKILKKHERAVRLSVWHPYFVLRPRIILFSNKERVFIWLSTIYRRALTSDLYNSYHDRLLKHIVRWEYCMDDFELLKDQKSEVNSK